MRSAFLHEQYPELDRIADDIRKKHDFSVIKDSTFRDLKEAWCVAREFLLSEPIPSEESQRDFVRQILGEVDKGWRTVIRGNRDAPGLWQQFKNTIGVGDSSDHSQQHRRSPGLSDPEFIAALHPLQSVYPVIEELTARIANCHEVYLAKAGGKLVKPYMDKVIDSEMKRRVRVCSDLRSNRQAAESQVAASALRDQLKAAMPSGRS